VKPCTKQGLKVKSRSLSYDLPGFVGVQEAIPAASSTAKPQTEEVMSQGEASEPLAQECLGEENQWEGEQPKNIKKKIERIRRGRKTSIT